MPTWEDINCGNESANTGVPTCIDDFEQLTGVIAIPKGHVIPAATLADEDALETYLSDKASADNAAERFYLLSPFDGFAQANTDAQTQTATNGRIRTTSKGFFGWDLTMWDYGRCAYKNLLKFHLSQDRFDFISIHGGTTIAGPKRKDAVGELGMGGVKMMQVHTPNWMMSDGGGTGTNYTIQFKVGDPEQLRTQYAGKRVDFDIASTAAGVIDVDLAVELDANSTYLVTPTIACGGANLTDTYEVELAANAVWIVTNPITGNAITINSITVTDGKVAIELDDTDPDYPAAGQKIKFAMAAISVLVANGIEGFEANTETIAVATS